MARLAQWCGDANAAIEADASADPSAAAGGNNRPARYGFIYVDPATFDAHPPRDRAELLTMFREYQPA